MPVLTGGKGSGKGMQRKRFILKIIVTLFYEVRRKKDKKQGMDFFVPLDTDC